MSIPIIKDCADYAKAIREFDDLQRARGSREFYNGGIPPNPETIRQKELRTAIKIYKPSFNE